MAVGDDLRALGETDELADPFRRGRPSGPLEQVADLEVPRARNVTLAGVALVAAAPAELVRSPHVKKGQRGISRNARPWRFFEPMPAIQPRSLIA